MNHNKPEVFGVVWVDTMLGPLSLAKASAADAIESARSIRARGADKVRNVRAVHVPAGADTLLDLPA